VGFTRAVTSLLCEILRASWLRLNMKSSRSASRIFSRVAMVARSASARGRAAIAVR
jgi:hypothetical protein